MMIGTILSNFWAALFSFSLYFLINFLKPISPFDILVGSFTFAILGFFIMFLIRYLIGYILFTPEESVLVTDLEESIKSNSLDDHQLSQNSSSSELNESPEEIAQVLKTMMNS